MAYPNVSIDQGGFGSLQADAAGALTLYQRVKFTNTADSNGSKPTIVVAGATDRAVAVVMQPIAASAFGTVRWLNAQGEQFGIASGTIPVGTLIYAAANGALSVSSAGGALPVGFSTTAGYDGGAFSYFVFTPAA